MNFAHVKWFIEQSRVGSYDELNFAEIAFVVAGVAAALAIIIFISNHKLYKSLDKRLSKILRKWAKWAPFIVRIVLGLTLVLNAWHEFLWAPDVAIDTTVQQYVSWLSAGLGILLIFGSFVRQSAILLSVLFIGSLFLIRPISVFEHLEYLGLGGYLALAGGGPLTLKFAASYDFHQLDKYRRHALKILRVAIGLSFIVLAFSEKLLGMDLAHEFLMHHDWNLLSFLGLGDRVFIIFAGISELAIGFSLIFNFAAKLISFGVLALFSLTAAILGPTEVAGHLFGVALVAAIWLNYPKEKVSLKKTK